MSVRKIDGVTIDADTIDGQAGGIPDAAVGDALAVNADIEVTVSGTDYGKVKEISLARAGTYRIKFDLRTEDTISTAFGRVYKNGAEVGAEQTSDSVTYATKSEDIAGWVAGDLCQLYTKNDAGGGERDAIVKNFRVYVSSPIDNRVIQD